MTTWPERVSACAVSPDSWSDVTIRAGGALCSAPSPLAGWHPIMPTRPATTAATRPGITGVEGPGTPEEFGWGILPAILDFLRYASRVVLPHALHRAILVAGPGPLRRPAIGHPKRTTTVRRFSYVYQ